MSLESLPLKIEFPIHDTSTAIPETEREYTEYTVNQIINERAGEIKATISTDDLSLAVQSTDTYEDKKGNELEKFKELIEKLSMGEIPNEFREEWELIDFESETGQAFHNYVLRQMEEAVKFHKEYCLKNNIEPNRFLNVNFDEFAVKFMLSKNLSPNAWYVGHSKPALLIITQGMINRLIERSEDLILVMGHELMHARIFAEKGKIKNSKGEEESANFLPLELLCSHPNYNPENGLELAKKMQQLQTKHSQVASVWSYAIDPHVIPENRVSLMETYLAGLRQSRGELIPEQGTDAYDENSEIKKISASAKFQRKIDRELESKGLYKVGNINEKIDILCDVFSNMEAEYIEPSKKWWLMHIDTVLSNYFKGLNVDTPKDSKEIINKHSTIWEQFLDKIKDSERAEILSQVYFVLNKSAKSLMGETSNDCVKLGSFREHNSWLEVFFRVFNKLPEYDETIEFDKDDWVELAWAAEEVVYFYKEHYELFKTEWFKEIYRNINFPRFQSIDLGDNDTGNKKFFQKREVFLPWQKIYPLALENENVAELILRNGAIFDPFMFNVLARHIDLMLQLNSSIGYIDDRYEVNSKRLNQYKCIDGRVISFDIDGRVLSLDTELFKRNIIEEVLVANKLQIATKILRDGNNIESKKDFIKKNPHLARSFFMKNPELAKKLFDYDKALFFEIILNTSKIELKNWLHLGDDLVPLIKTMLKQYPEIKNELFEFVDHKAFWLWNNESLLRATRILEYETHFESQALVILQFTRRNPLWNLVREHEPGKLASKKISDKFIMMIRQWIFPDYKYNFRVPLEILKKILDYNNWSASYELDETQNIEMLSGDNFMNYFFSEGYYNEGQRIITDLVFCSYVEKENNLEKLMATLLKISVVAWKWSEFSSFIISKFKNHAVKYLDNLKSIDNYIEQFILLQKFDCLFPEETKNILSILLIRLENTPKSERFLILKKLFDTEKYDGRKILDEAQDANSKLIGDDEFQVLLQNDFSPKLLRIDDFAVRQTILSLLSESAILEFGKDDCSEEWLKKSKDFIDWAFEVLGIAVAVEFCDIWVVAANGQEVICDYIRKKINIGTEDAILKNSVLQGFVDMTSFLVKKNQDFRQKLLDYILKNNGKKELLVINELASDIREIVVIAKEIELSIKDIEAILSDARDNFWGLPVAARMVFLKEYFRPPNAEGIKKEDLSYALCQAVPQNSKYAEESRQILTAYVNALPDYQQYLSLSGLMTAAEKNNERPMSLGESLAFVLENLGPAETKIGQAAESHPNVPEDLKSGLKRLKHNAARPYRWGMMNRVTQFKTDLLKDYCQRNGLETGSVSINKVGNILGSGSIYVAVEIELTDGSNHVLAMRRENVQARGENSFNVFERMIQSLAGEEKNGETLRELGQFAMERLRIEADCSLAEKQHQFAEELFVGSSVTVDGKKFTFNSPLITAQGEDYFLMEKMEGKHFLEITKKRQERYALPILALNLKHILIGRFDSDRHGGNIKVQGNKINNFDFKATYIGGWNENDYDQLARLFLGLMEFTGNFENVIEAFMKAETKIRETEKVGPLVIEVKKALLSLGEFMTTEEDFRRCLMAALRSGVEPRLKKALIANANESIKPMIEMMVAENQDGQKIKLVL